MKYALLSYAALIALLAGQACKPEEVGSSLASSLVPTSSVTAKLVFNNTNRHIAFDKKVSSWEAQPVTDLQIDELTLTQETFELDTTGAHITPEPSFALRASSVQSQLLCTGDDLTLNSAATMQCVSFSQACSYEKRGVVNGDSCQCKASSGSGAVVKLNQFLSNASFKPLCKASGTANLTEDTNTTAQLVASAGPIGKAHPEAYRGFAQACQQAGQQLNGDVCQCKTPISLGYFYNASSTANPNMKLKWTDAHSQNLALGCSVQADHIAECVKIYKEFKGKARVSLSLQPGLMGCTCANGPTHTAQPVLKFDEPVEAFGQACRNLLSRQPGDDLH